MGLCFPDLCRCYTERGMPPRWCGLHVLLQNLQLSVGWRICERQGCAAVGVATADFNHGQSFISFKCSATHSQHGVSTIVCVPSQRLIFKNIIQWFRWWIVHLFPNEICLTSTIQCLESSESHVSCALFPKITLANPSSESCNDAKIRIRRHFCTMTQVQCRRKYSPRC